MTTKKELKKQETFKLLDSMFGYLLKDTQEEIDLQNSIKKNKLLLKQDDLNEQERIKIHNNLIDDLIALNSIVLTDCKNLKKQLKSS
jgi:hypothetical protein